MPSDHHELIAPADAGRVLTDVLAVLARHIRANPALQRELLAVLAPVVRSVAATPHAARPPRFSL